MKSFMSFLLMGVFMQMFAVNNGIDMYYSRKDESPIYSYCRADPYDKDCMIIDQFLLYLGQHDKRWKRELADVDNEIEALEKSRDKVVINFINKRLEPIEKEQTIQALKHLKKNIEILIADDNILNNFFVQAAYLSEEHVNEIMGNAFDGLFQKSCATDKVLELKLLAHAISRAKENKDAEQKTQVSMRWDM